MLNRAWLWVRSVVMRRRLEREMQEEMAEHLERSSARLMARGLSAEEARREAIREFGNVTYLQEEGRNARGTLWLDALLTDVRFALRQFARRPGTTLTMFIVLSVGMSISSLLFSYVHSYAVQPPLGVPLAEDLVRIRGSQSAGTYGRAVRGFSEEEFLEYRALTDPFRSVAGWTTGTVAVDAGEEADRRGLEGRATFVTANYFSVLGVRPALGVGLPTSESEDASLGTVGVIGHTAWDQLFAGDPEVIGSTVAVNGVPVTIVGVAPERFIGVGAPSSLQLWIPLSARAALGVERTGDFRAVGRLRAGVGLDAASAATGLVASRAAESDPALRERDPSTEVVQLLAANGDPMFDQDVRLMSFAVGLLGLLVLLVACTNVSALLTGLAMARRQEIAIRLSLGAGRTRLIRQLLTESALLASLAGMAALGALGLVLRAAAGFLQELPLELRITWPVTIFTFGTALSVGVLFGLSPALHATRLALASALRDSNATIAAARARLQRGLVAAQIAFTQPLIVLLAAVLVLVLREYRPESRTEVADRIVTVSLQSAAPVSGEATAEAQVREELRRTVDRLIGKLEGTAGVEAAVIDWRNGTPPGSYFVHPADRVAGTPERAIRLSGEMAAAGYFELMGIPVVRGREFAERDVGTIQPGAGEVPVIVRADLARRLWLRADPIGRRLTAASDSTAGARTLVVTGVIDDPLAEARRAGEEHRVYLPPDSSLPFPGILIRTAGAAAPLLPVLRGVIQTEAPTVATRIRTLREIEDLRRRHFTIVTGGVSAAGLMALLLSAIGLYAVVAFTVGQRTGEIAVRIAVGASGRQIAGRFIRDGLRLSAVGLAFGLPVSLIGLRMVMTDPDVPSVSLASVSIIAALGVVLVATAAAWIPARHAARVDPAVILRS